MSKYTFQEARDYILGIPKFSGKNSIEATGKFYEYLGKPGSSSKAIHVAGTNGKGSVCAYVSSVLQTAGFSVGMFTSPHLITIRERILLNGMQISEQEFTDIFTLLREQLEAYPANAAGEYHPSFFEWLFFMAALYYEEKKPDYVLWETGLGGRLDATNVADNKVACVITKISYDHTEYLGNTLREIAGEKAGIIRKGVPVVTFDYGTEAFEVICSEAKNKGAILEVVEKEHISFLKFGDKTIDFSMYTRYYDYIGLKLHTVARYQVENAAMAVRVVACLPDAERITAEDIVAGIGEMKWAGRMEEAAPGVYLEGAHNPDGIEAFLNTVRQLPGNRKHLLFAVVADKQYDRMIELIAKADVFDTYTVTTVGGARGLSTTQVRGLFEQYTEKKVDYEEDIVNAYQKCHGNLGENDRLFVAGSLYLVGQVKEYLGNLEA